MIRRPVVAGLISVLCLILSPPVPAAPQNSSDSSAIFTSNSELVLVPVQVTDHYGHPLHGLKQEDFVVKSDGKLQHIGLFEEMQTPQVAPPKPPLILVSSPDPASVPSAAPAALPEKFTNLRRDALPQQLFIVALDNVNTPIRLQSWAREQLIRYLHNSPPLQPMEVVAITPSGLRRVHDFTTDTAALIDSIRKMHSNLNSQDSPEPLLSRMDSSGRIDTYASLINQVQENQALAASRNLGSGMLTLHTFEQLAWAYSGIPGRKTVLWLTTGFPLMPEVPDGPGMLGRGAANTRGLPASAGQHPSGELLPEFQRAFTAMTKANVMVYPVDVAGLPLDHMWDISQPAGLYIHPELTHLSGYQLPDTSADGRDGMKEMANRTGGKSCTAGNSLSFCLDQALSESSDYYLLGFYVSQQQRKAGWHKLKVNVNGNLGEVHSRNSYFLRALGTPRQREQEEDLRGAILAPVDYTGILFTVEPGTRAASPSAPISFKVSVPASSILLQPGEQKLSFEVIAIPLSGKGAPVLPQARIVKLDMTPEIAQKALMKGWSLVNSVPGDSTVVAVKIVVRDDTTGRIGTVMLPVTRPKGS